MLLLVKRHKTTYFVEASQHDTVQKLKARISHILNKEKEPKELRLFFRPPKQTGLTPLEDAAVLEQVGVVDYDTLFLVYWINDGADGKWETVDVPPFEPLHDDMDATAAGGVDKGKAAA
ncbi:hypothetical protein HK105_202577 [Polyrhizophydium stewartii]|uniref:Ubiquitin-like domain-containing protein n=1 Tax=Polyrhizophydium stewartii TaxID=2732419 RepID=A0ABR4NE20_9FUNG|nr:hypothetical protein HK105_004779 [Polyrhizophydium stewartii]